MRLPLFQGIFHTFLLLLLLLEPVKVQILLAACSKRGQAAGFVMQERGRFHSTVSRVQAPRGLILPLLSAGTSLTPLLPLEGQLPKRSGALFHRRVLRLI